MVPLVKPIPEFSTGGTKPDGGGDLTSSVEPEQDRLLLLTLCGLSPDIELQAVLANRIPKHLSGIDELRGSWSHNVDFAVGNG